MHKRLTDFSLPAALLMPAENIDDNGAVCGLND